MKKIHIKKEYSIENGNALFLILVAIALFAALAYAVTQTGKEGGTVDKETTMLHASLMIQQVSQIEQAITRLRLVNKCTDTQISFENPVVPGYTNPSAPADKSCHVFDRAGGGLIWPTVPLSLMTVVNTYQINANNRVLGIGTDDLTASAMDLIIVFTRIKREVCSDINAKLGILAAGTTPPDADDIQFGAKFTGTYTYTASKIPATVAASMFTGKTSGCVQEASNAGSPYTFYHVLIAR